LDNEKHRNFSRDFNFKVILETNCDRNIRPYVLLKFYVFSIIEKMFPDFLATVSLPKFIACYSKVLMYKLIINSCIISTCWICQIFISQISPIFLYSITQLNTTMILSVLFSFIIKRRM
jgi:hypothetical protein